MTIKEKIEHAAFKKYPSIVGRTYKDRMLLNSGFIDGANHVLANLTEFDEVRELMKIFKNYLDENKGFVSEFEYGMNPDKFISDFLASKNGKG